jgi:hypothetical protein
MLCCLQPAFATPTTPSSDFIDNGDGTVTHKLTGLVWMRCSMGQTWDKATTSCTGTVATYTYAQAIALTNTFAGKSDWRLPNIAELRTIVERENINPAINTTLFPNTPADSFWSSSPSAYNSSNGWFVDSIGGGFDYVIKSNYNAVRLVRAGQLFVFLPSTTPTVDFVDNKNGTVIHKRTGLIWQRCPVGSTWTGSTCSGTATAYTYDEAMALKSNFAGKSDWRLPNQNELLSIAEYGSYNPAINTTIFPNTPPQSAFWSASLIAHAGGSNSAWITLFDDGSDFWCAKYGTNYVRLVRSGQLFGFLSLDLATQSAISLDFASNYDAKNAQIVELKNTSAKAIKVSNVMTSDAGSYWVNLFVDDKPACRAANYAVNLKNFTIPAKSSCKISVGFSPFDNLTAGKSVAATIILKTVINGVATDKTINVTGIGRMQVANAYNNKTGSLWGQNTWGMAELKGGNPPINTTLVGASSKYSSAKFWYGSVTDSTLQKATANVGNVVVFAQNSASSAGHVGVVIQTSPVITMLSMNDIKDANGVKVRKWSVRPVDWYPNKTAIWSPLITGFNASDATRHYGFVDWNSSLY